MMGWLDGFVRELGSRVQEVDRGLASLLVRFDNGLYLRLEPLSGGKGLLLEFRLFFSSDGTVVILPMSVVSRHFRGARGYRVIKKVVLSSSRDGATPDDSAALDDVRTAVAGTSGRLRVWEATRSPSRSDGAPARVAGAEFMVVGDLVRWSQPLEYSAVPPRILVALDRVEKFLSDSTRGPS